MSAKKPKAVNVAEAKRHFSELLGRVAYGGETVTITRRGRPMAKLVPLEYAEPAPHPSELRGWLHEGDPFFEAVEERTATRASRPPRVYGGGDDSVS